VESNLLMAILQVGAGAAGFRRGLHLLKNPTLSELHEIFSGQLFNEAF
jgi:hypothetical protein